MKKAVHSAPKQRLKEERELRGWSQKYVAEQIGADHYYLSRWERGSASPSPYYRQRLCALFGKNARELGLLPEEDDTGQKTSAAETERERKPAPSAGILDPVIPLPSAGLTSLIGREEMLDQLKRAEWSWPGGGLTEPGENSRAARRICAGGSAAARRPGSGSPTWGWWADWSPADESRGDSHPSRGLCAGGEVWMGRAGTGSPAGRSGTDQWDAAGPGDGGGPPGKLHTGGNILARSFVAGASDRVPRPCEPAAIKPGLVNNATGQLRPGGNVPARGAGRGTPGGIPRPGQYAVDGPWVGCRRARALCAGRGALSRSAGYSPPGRESRTSRLPALRPRLGIA